MTDDRQLQQFLRSQFRKLALSKLFIFISE